MFENSLKSRFTVNCKQQQKIYNSILYKNAIADFQNLENLDFSKDAICFVKTIIKLEILENLKNGISVRELRGDDTHSNFPKDVSLSGVFIALYNEKVCNFLTCYFWEF